MPKVCGELLDKMFTQSVVACVGLCSQLSILLSTASQLRGLLGKLLTFSTVFHDSYPLLKPAVSICYISNLSPFPQTLLLIRKRK